MATGETTVNSKRFNLRTLCPGGKLPPATAGRDACRYIEVAHRCARGRARSGTLREM